MNFWNIIQNPIIIGLVAGVIAYMYIKWKNDKEYLKKKKRDPNTKQKPVNLLIPAIAFIVFVILSHFYLESQNTNTQIDLSTTEKKNYKFIKEMTEISEPNSFNLISTGIQMPNNLPEILFELN
ncbi:hypothetical protein BMW23_0542 [Bodo saltans virus]|uniref:Transmembrane protein n=1 Tax=Bodo saltans virus TaxID=2024608 RepID=A0A2H4UUR5_9VIRU|nr:hypothetical protein QJ851_gp0526 [Bodo saltans virus]ATZ80589.1 hypothetical protein BMW23_0542 [Bodo saltans virus]